MRKEYDFSKGKRGPVVSAPTGKKRITIRLDDEVLEWFKKQVDDAGGGNYQTLINQALQWLDLHSIYNQQIRESISFGAMLTVKARS